MEHMEVYSYTTINAARHHDKDAIEALYRETYGMVYGSVRTMVSDEYLAEDIVQDAFIKGFQSLDQLSDPQKYPSWMKRIAVNRVKDYYRKHKPVLFTQMETDEGNVPEFVDDRIAELPEMVIDQKETARLLNEILDSLPDDQHIAIAMFYYQEMSVRDIAAALGCSESTVKSRLNYGRKKIETRVRALEKRGTKLYGLAPIPFLLVLLRNFKANIPSLAAPELGVAEIVGQSTDAVAATHAADTASRLTKIGQNVISSVSEFVKQHMLLVILCPIVAITAAVVVPPLLQSDTPSTQPVISAEDIIDSGSKEQPPAEETSSAVPAGESKTIYRIVKEDAELRFGVKVITEYEYHPGGYRLSGSYSAINENGSTAKWETIYHYNGSNPFLPSDMQLYDSGGTLKLTYAYEYDDQNRLIKQTRYNGDIGVEVDYVYTCSYNGNGQKEYVRLETCYGNWADRTYYYDGDRIVKYEEEYMPAYFAITGDPNYEDAIDYSYYIAEFEYDDAAGTVNVNSIEYCLPTAVNGGHYREIHDNEQFDDAGNVVSYDEHVVDDEFLHREIEYAAFEVPVSAPLYSDLPARYTPFGNAEFDLTTDGDGSLIAGFSFWSSDMSLEDFYFEIDRGEG